MRKIVSVIDHELAWAQPRVFKSEYELRFGDEVVATLRFPKKLFSTLAVAQTEEGTWNFERVGFWQRRIVVRQSDSKAELGVYTRNAWKHGGTLELPGGRKYELVANLWRSIIELRTMESEDLIKMETHGVFRYTASVQMYRKVRQLAELPWMVPFAFYLGLMMKRDAARHAAAAG